MQVEKIMRTLHVRRLILWPRFQQYVQEELGAHPPEVRSHMTVWAPREAFLRH